MKHLRNILPLLLFQCLSSQNLVNNPSFEDYLTCPTDNSFDIPDWYRLPSHSGTVDYMNVCASPSSVSVPTSSWGTQLPYDGNGYMGMANYYADVPLREYAQTRLTIPLAAGKYYHVSFQVSLTDTSQYATHVGAVFTSTPLHGDLSLGYINISPQVNSNHAIDDKVNWFEVSGTFKAVGGEEYLSIGNFLSNDFSVLLQQVGVHPGAYYFIDNVKVTEIDDVPVEQNCLNILNPVSDVIHFGTSDDLPDEITIIDLLGKTIKRKLTDKILYVGNLQNGVYIIQYFCGTKPKSLKIIKA